MNKEISITLIVVVFVVVFSCSDKHATDVKSVDPYIENIKAKLPRMDGTFVDVPVSSSVLQLRRIEILDTHNRFVAVDESDHSIVLLNRQGEILSKAGGEGRGPGEFENIAQLHVGFDGHIYLLDMFLFRITAYEVENDSLKHIESFSYKNPPSHSLHRIYITKYGIFGVYNQSEGFQAPENQFILYRLDQKFRPQSELLKMPGNERQKVPYSKGVLYMPNILLNRTFWDVDEEWFYFTTSYESSIHKFSLKTGIQKTALHLQFEERLKTDQHTKFFKDRFNQNQYEEQWSLVEERTSLPIFSGFWVQNDKIILRMFYPAEKQGMMIYANQSSDKIKYLNIPHELSQISLLENKIYGINFGDDNYNFISIDLE